MMKETTYYTVLEQESTIYSFRYGQVFMLSFQMHPDIVEEQRQVYSFWDFIGDLGGLNDFLKLVGGILVSIQTAITGSGLSRFLTKNLFYVKKESKAGKLRRKPAKFRVCLWLQKDRRAKDLFTKATERIQSELDLVNFLRHQMIDKVHRRLIFTPNERYYMSHQANPFLLRP